MEKYSRKQVIIVNQPIRTYYLGHVIGYRPIRDPNKLDGKPGGGGITCISQDGTIFEKAGNYFQKQVNNQSELTIVFSCSIFHFH